MSKPDLSIIILNYNVRQLLINCLESVYKNKSKDDNFQVIVLDNDSSDGSFDEIKKRFPEVKAIQNGKNLGFSKGNNAGIPFVLADFVLFLNPDTEAVGQVIRKSLAKIKEDDKIGALSCRVELPDGSLDYSCHRGFPSPWNSFSYFSGLSKLFPRSKFFSGYTATYLDTNTSHEIDCVNGSFLLVRKTAGDQIGWWDKDYFWNGEDIEFCFSLKERGWIIFYYPEEKIIHYKGSSSGLWDTSSVEVSKETKIRSAKHATAAMRIFYKKHYYKNYPFLIRDLILFSIKALEVYRLFLINLGLNYK